MNEEFSIEDIKKIVNNIIRSISIRGYDKEDLKMEGILEGIKALEEYDPKYNTKVSSYVYGRVKFKMLQLIRYSSALKRTPKESITLEATLLAETGEFYGHKLFSIENQEKDYLISEKFEELYAAAKKTLTNSENRIFELYLQGYTAREISIKEKEDYKKIANKLSYIKKKIRIYETKK